VPDAVAELTAERTVTAFLDGDRGGDLILEELGQVGAVDYVAVAPRGHSVEDLSRDAVMAALRDKVPYDSVAEADSPAAALDAAGTTVSESDGGTAVASVESGEVEQVSKPETAADGAAAPETETAAPETEAKSPEADTPPALSDHVDDIISRESGAVRLLDAELTVLAEGDSADVMSLIESCEPVPRTVVLDGTCTQKVLDIAAQRGIEHIVAAEEGEFVKQPASVQTRTA